VWPWATGRIGLRRAPGQRARAEVESLTRFAFFACVLLQALRRIGLRHAQFASATCGAIRLEGCASAPVPAVMSLVACPAVGDPGQASRPAAARAGRHGRRASARERCRSAPLCMLTATG
jgi:hypothetical protein